MAVTREYLRYQNAPSEVILAALPTASNPQQLERIMCRRAAGAIVRAWTRGHGMKLSPEIGKLIHCEMMPAPVA